MTTNSSIETKYTPNSTWQPQLGAWPVSDGIRFRLWAPVAQKVDVIVDKKNSAAYPLLKTPDGHFEGTVSGLQSGDLYRYRIDGKGPFPDPASRFQPKGVHEASQIVDPRRFEWTDSAWKGVSREALSLYELHLGTFSPEGTYAGATKLLPYLADLGVTAVELMPVADFPGSRNWGYDGVALFAPAHVYGTPEELRTFVNAAHQQGLAVFQDVVYNHLGPDGNYLSQFSPNYFTERHQSPWGAGVNLDGEGSESVREYFMQNALYWIHEFHMDGLRLDATHAIIDDSPRHFLAELTERVHRSVSNRTVLVTAEDCRNLAHIIKPSLTPESAAAEKGWNLDGVWADDFHHEVRRMLAGDHESYYSDFTGTVADLVTTINKGWIFCGQNSKAFKGPRGSDPAGITPDHFVFFIQNHDQIGNRAFGERLHHQIDAAAYRAASTLFLCTPQTPMLFMGQEWGASAPFLFFTDHNEELGRLITEGRRKEFQSFETFTNPANRERIPDPQKLETFKKSRLNWEEMKKPDARGLHRLYQTLLRLRRREPALAARELRSWEAYAVSEEALWLRRSTANAPTVWAIFQMKGTGDVDLKTTGRLETILTTEDPPFTPHPLPPSVHITPGGARLHFARPGAVLLREVHG